MTQKTQFVQKGSKPDTCLLSELEKSLPKEQAQFVFKLIRELQLGQELSLETQVLQSIELQALKERLTFLRLLERRIAVYTKPPDSA